MPERKKKDKTSDERMAVLQSGYQAILEFIDKMEQLIQFQDRIDIPSNIEQIWSVLLEDIRSLISIEACALFLVDEDSYEFVLNNVSPGEKESICRDEIRLQIECDMFSWVINRRQPSILPSLVFRDEKTIIMLPLSTMKRTLGVVLLLTSIEEESITRENIKLLTLLAKQCSLVMENTLLYENLRKEHDSLQEAQDQIIEAEKLASIGRLTAGASHEILNPLNIISSYIQFMLMDKNLDPGIMKYLNIMRGQSERISRIVKGLLQFSQYPNETMVEVNINDIILNALSVIEHEARANRIEIIMDFSNDLPVVMGNAENLSRAFFNLLSNSKDSLSEGGTIRISTRIAPGSHDKSKGSNFIEITVEDNGCGISEDNINKIFEPFFSTKDTGDRTGLGLSISYGIIKEHGGNIDVKSGVNKGTVFIVTLPFKRETG